MCSLPKLPSATVGGADGARVGGATLLLITLPKQRDGETRTQTQARTHKHVHGHTERLRQSADISHMQTRRGHVHEDSRGANSEAIIRDYNERPFCLEQHDAQRIQMLVVGSCEASTYFAMHVQFRRSMISTHRDLLRPLAWQVRCGAVTHIVMLRE